MLSRDVKVDWYCFELRTIDSQREGEEMRPGDLLKTSKPIRSQKTGVVLPRENKDTARNGNRDANSQSAGFQEKS